MDEDMPQIVHSPKTTRCNDDSSTIDEDRSGDEDHDRPNDEYRPNGKDDNAPSS